MTEQTSVTTIIKRLVRLLLFEVRRKKSHAELVSASSALKSQKKQRRRIPKQVRNDHFPALYFIKLKCNNDLFIIGFWVMRIEFRISGLEFRI